MMFEVTPNDMVRYEKLGIVPIGILLREKDNAKRAFFELHGRIDSGNYTKHDGVYRIVMHYKTAEVSVKHDSQKNDSDNEAYTIYMKHAYINTKELFFSEYNELLFAFNKVAFVLNPEWEQL